MKYSSIISYYCRITSLLLIAAFVSFSLGLDDDIDFPPQLDADDIRYFSENYDIDGLHWALTNVFRRSSRNFDTSKIVYELPSQIVSRGGGSTYTTEYKLQMDLEQAEYLLEKNLLNEDEVSLFRDVVIPSYKQVLSKIPHLDQLKDTNGLYPFSQADIDANILNIYNKALHQTDVHEPVDENGIPISLLSESFNAKQIEARWFGEDSGSRYPAGIVVIDDLLSPSALTSIRKLMLESTVFYQTKMPLKFGGYAGAYIDDGLHDRILLALAFELNKALPRIMKGNPLRYLWAYKYDSDYSGISTHADEAAVNVNIWLTPDEASLDANNGGLVVYTAKPPVNADFASYNTDTERLIEEIIKPTEFANVTVPFKMNRAIMFDSALFHHTDSFKFKKGYENRRINLTILYGNMNRGSDKGNEQKFDEL